MDKLSQMENSNPKMFWQLIRNLRHDRQQGNPINLDIWEKYYKCLSQNLPCTMGFNSDRSDKK